MGVLIGPNTLYYVIVRPKGKLREDFDFSDEKVRKPALLRPEMGERGTGDMATTVIAITNQKAASERRTTAAALLTGLHRRGAAVSNIARPRLTELLLLWVQISQSQIDGSAVVSCFLVCHALTFQGMTRGIGPLRGPILLTRMPLSASMPQQPSLIWMHRMTWPEVSVTPLEE